MKKGVLICLVLIVFLISLTNAATETFYVCQGGDGSSPESGACSAAWNADDFSSLGNWDADDQNDGLIGPNDQVIILDDGGTITGSGTEVFNIRSSGLSGRPITISGEPGSMPVVDGEHVRIALDTVDKDYIVLENIEFKRGLRGTINCWNCNNWIIQGIKAHDTLNVGANDGSCIFLFGDNNILRRSELYNTVEDHGIYLGNDADNNIIEYNDFHDLDSFGVHINTGTLDTVTGNIIRYNWFEDNLWGDIGEESGDGTEIYGNIFVKNDTDKFHGVIVYGDGSGNPATNVKIHNNVFYGNYRRMIYIGQGGGSLYDGNVDSIKNNIFYQTSGNQGDNAFIAKNTVGSVLTSSDYNQFYNTQGGDINRFYWEGGTDTSPDTLSAWQTETGFDGNSDDADPSFLNAGIDFSLNSGSPAINNGTDLGSGTCPGVNCGLYNVVKSDWLNRIVSSSDLIDRDSYSSWDIGAFEYRGVSSSPELIAHYAFDEGTGTIVGDSSGNGNDATVNGATWTNGIISGALSFDGTNDYVTTPYIDYSSLPALTITFWVYVPQDNPSGHNIVLGNADNNCGEGFSFSHYSNENWYFYHASQTMPVNPVIYGWQHVALIIEPNTEKRAYINGILESQSGIGTYNLDTGNNTFIGMSSFGDYYNGTIDDIRIYNYALTSQEILDLYNQISQSSCSSADINSNSIIEIGELLTYISDWKAGGVLIGDLLTAIGEWKNGC